MVELMITAGLVLWCAAGFVAAGAGTRSAQRIADRITRMGKVTATTIDEMNYATRRQQEQLLEWDSDPAHLRMPADRQPRRNDERPLA